MIADRLGQYVAMSHRDGAMLDQAIKLFEFADRLDETYLERRIREDTGRDLGLEYLRKHAV
jgi:hypothetical protein